jgi:hypothetical protein
MAKPGPHGKDRQRCGARVRHRHGRLGLTGYCKNWPTDGQHGRSYLHGGKPAGPRTPEGLACPLAAMTEGRRRGIERRQDEGKKIPSGRKAGNNWITPAMRSREKAAQQVAMPKPQIPKSSRPEQGRPSKAEIIVRFIGI